MHPRLQLGASGRPLNFTVRSHLGEIQGYEEQEAPPFAAAICERQLAGSSCRRLRLAQPVCACGASEMDGSGRAPSTLPRGGVKFRPRGPFDSGLARLLVWYVAFGCRGSAARAQWQLVGCLLTITGADARDRPGEAR